MCRNYNPKISREIDANLFYFLYGVFFCGYHIPTTERLNVIVTLTRAKRCYTCLLLIRMICVLTCLEPTISAGPAKVQGIPKV